MPGLRYVLDPRLAFVADHNECQCVCVRPAELIHARAFARVGNSPHVARLLNRDGITRHAIVAPKLCFGRHGHDVKSTVSVQCPDSTKRVGPCADERGRAGRSGRASAEERDNGDCKNNSESVL